MHGQELRASLPDDLLTIDEVRDLLKVPKSWLYERTRRHAVPHVKLGKYLRFPRVALLEWIEAMHRSAPAQPSDRRDKSEGVPGPEGVARRAGRPLRGPSTRGTP